MADLDDLREGADFGLGINCEYSLIIEEGTPFAEKKPELPDEGYERPSVPYLQPEDRQGGYACF